MTAGALAVARSLPPKADVGRSRAATVEPVGPIDFKPSALPPVRALVAMGSTLSVEIAGPYLATAPDDWRVLAQGSSLPVAAVTATPTGLQIGARTFSSDKIDLRVVQPDTLWIGAVRYPGHLRLVRRADGRIAAVNLVGLEDYVLNSLGRGGGPDSARDARRQASEESSRAEAIVLRSRAMYEMKTAAAGSPWDVDASTPGKAYRGLESREDAPSGPRQDLAALRAAVGPTRAVVLSYQGRLFCTYLTAACGGHTLDGRAVFPVAAPPLVGVACPACRNRPDSSWEKTIAGQQLRARVAAYCQKTGQSLGPLTRIDVSAAPAGRVPEVTLVGAQGTCRLSAHLFRTQVAGEELLPGSVFTVEKREDEYRFSGRGEGHGVGLCLAGAAEMAQRHHTCLEILAHYFPGAELIPVW